MANMNYNQARIYKITCNLPTINEIYIGSTADYENRCIKHRHDCYNVNSNNYSCKVYNYIRANGGFGNFTIDVIEHYPCVNKTAMRIREQYWINEYKPTLNTNRAYRTDEELKEDIKQYRTNNKDYFNQYNNQYRTTNLEYFKQYRTANKEQLRSKAKQVIQCSHCDKTYTKQNKTHHQKSKYCKNFKSTTSESSTESFIESDTDVE
jgi:hypothetical protein